MQKLKIRNFLSISDVNKTELENILDIAKKFKKAKNIPQILKGKNIVLIFQKPSTRTRVSFEAAINKLGGNCISLNWNELQLGRGETVEDTAKVLERYGDCIVARVFSHEDLIRMSKAARVPVVNALSDLEHPCQTLADLLTISESVGFKNVEKIAYVGDGNNNVCHSLMLGCNLLKLPLTVGCPREYRPRREIVEKVDTDLIKVVSDPVEAVKDSDVIYTDVWISMGMESEKDARMKVFSPYQVNKSLVKYAKKSFVFLHCLPAHRGQEVTSEVMDSKNSAVFSQAENRMWTQMALLYFLFK
jgi:ornithine carbamoyltransferase